MLIFKLDLTNGYIWLTFEYSGIKDLIHNCRKYALANVKIVASSIDNYDVFANALSMSIFLVMKSDVFIKTGF